MVEPLFGEETQAVWWSISQLRAFTCPLTFGVAGRTRSRRRFITLNLPAQSSPAPYPASHCLVWYELQHQSNVFSGPISCQQNSTSGLEDVLSSSRIVQLCVNWKSMRIQHSSVSIKSNGTAYTNTIVKEERVLNLCNSNCVNVSFDKPLADHCFSKAWETSETRASASERLVGEISLTAFSLD